MAKSVNPVSVSKNGRKAMVIITDTEDKGISETLHLKQHDSHRDLFTSKDGRVFNKQKVIDMQPFEFGK